MECLMANDFEFPGFSVLSRESRGFADIIVGQLIDEDVQFTVTLVRMDIRPDSAFLVRTITAGGRVVWEEAVSRGPGDYARLVPTELGPVIALCRGGFVHTVTFLREGMDGDGVSENIAARAVGKMSAAEYLGVTPWFVHAEHELVSRLQRKHCQEQVTQEDIARKAASAKLLAQAEEKKRQGHAEKEQRRRVFENEVRKRLVITGVTREGRYFNGTPVLENEVARVPTGMCVITVTDLRNPYATMLEYFRVERSSGGRVTRNFVATVSAASAPAATGKSAIQSARREVRPLRHVHVAGEPDVPLYSSMSDIRTLRERHHLRIDTYVATPSEKKDDTRVIVYRVVKDGLHTIGLRQPV